MTRTIRRLWLLAKDCRFDPRAIWRDIETRLYVDETALEEDPSYRRYCNICDKFGLVR